MLILLKYTASKVILHSGTQSLTYSPQAMVPSDMLLKNRA